MYGLSAIVRGRDALATDADPVIVINRAMADKYWKDADPIGQRLRIGRTGTAPWMRVVGVVENVRHFGLETEPAREIFVPYRQNAWPTMTIVARTAGEIQTEPGDAAVTVVIAAVVLSVGLLASWVPARRASGVDPTTVLRQD